MFRISGSNSVGAIAVETTSSVEAIQKAVELMGKGMSKVTIMAPDGAIYPSGEFDRLFRTSMGR